MRVARRPSRFQHADSKAPVSAAGTSPLPPICVGAQGTPRPVGGSAYGSSLRVLLTGVSGTGKSSLVKELRSRGYFAYDADDDGFTQPLPDGTWGWRLNLVRSLFDQHGDRLLLFAGCSDEQTQFRFDFKVLLTAPVEVILDRLRARTTNSFGKSQAERDRVLTDMEWVLPLLRISADLIVDTTRPVSEVADAVVDAVASHGGRNT